MAFRLRRTTGIVAALAAVAGTALAVPSSATASVTTHPTSTRSAQHLAPRTIGVGGTVHYAVDQPLCAVPKDPTANRCFAVKRVPATKNTPGSYAYSLPKYIGLGPGGGYTPDDIAKAYGVNPATPASSQTVAIIDWYDDPKALADLNFFDETYGLKPETSTSFRKVNQKGKTSPLPKADKNSSGEIALDIESVRGLCHTCKILLIEANDGFDADLAIAENLAVKMGATEISNSFGEPERKVSSSVLAAYNHPGVVITASTGDDGWYAWDRANDNNGYSANAPSFPSSSSSVVAVGGTTLALHNDGTRLEEDVWNENGADDQVGASNGHQGAGGGGCSKIYTAPAWQAAYPGYSAAGCNGKRLAADISADADSASGFDVYLTYSNTPGWATIGGTSLASPLVAAMYALAGGSHGAAYPAATLYANGKVRPSSIFDVIAGGNGFCAGDTTLNCGTEAQTLSNGATTNPNLLAPGAGGKGHSLVDCSFPATGSPVTAPPMSSECNAVTGYDGPSGLGTPNNLGVFQQTNDTVTLTHSTLFKLESPVAFTATTKQAVAGTTPVKYTWNFGDGSSKSTTTGKTAHTYTKAGMHVVSVTVTDNRHQLVIKSVSTSVGRAPTVKYSIPATAKAHAKAKFVATKATALNTGAKIKSIVWKFGDGASTSTASPTHAYAKMGTFTAVLTVTDTSGVALVVRKQVKVS